MRSPNRGTARPLGGASMARRLIWLTLIGSIVVTTGCGKSTSVQRNYTKTVSLDGTPVLEVECEYVGKQPGDKNTYQNSHDYRRIDTDFYRLTFRNLTDNSMTVDGVTYRMETGETHGLQSASADSIRRTWGTNTIPPQSSISRANNMVWAKGRRNKMLKTYSFQLQTERGAERLEAEVPLVYER